MPHSSPIARHFRLFVAVNLLLFVLLAALFVVGYLVNRERSDEGRRAKQAICALRSDLGRRIATTEQFLNEHKGPEPLLGVPRSTFLSGLENQRHTFDALAVARCND